jgi:hypothetical protein
MQMMVAEISLETLTDEGISNVNVLQMGLTQMIVHILKSYDE